MAQVVVHLDAKGIKALQDAMKANARASGPMRTVYTQWAFRYQGFVRRRFDTFSNGGGNWKPLALSTILARRTGSGGTFGQAIRKKQGQIANIKFAKARFGKKDSAQIIALKKQLAIAKNQKKYARSAKLVGQLKNLGERAMGVKILRDRGVMFQGLTLGQYGNLKEDLPNGVRYGFAKVPNPRAKGTIASIAGYHNWGTANGRPPRRAIIVNPDEQTRNGMMSDLARGIRAVAKGTP